ncbi:MAG: hypothetical protein GF341_10790 [candidate division Zixibacteria bacterium]|nr:hypothetical protein [candidate division Zixibacteria bacterium]
MNLRPSTILVLVVSAILFVLSANSYGFALTLAAFFTLGIFSFLYKDNPMYKFCEAVFVGISAGYWFVSLYYQNLLAKLIDPLVADPVGSGAIPYYVVAILGIMMLMRLVPSIGWISRWPLSVIVGATAGLWFITYLQSNAMLQLQNTIMPIQEYAADGSLNWYQSIGNLTVMIGTITGVIYFFFSKEHKGAFGTSAKVGIWFLMITFGASFGYTVMSRMSLLIGRMDFLFGDWLQLIL